MVCNIRSSNYELKISSKNFVWLNDCLLASRLDYVDCVVNGHLEVVMTFLTVIRLDRKIKVFFYSGWLFNPFTATGTMSH